MKPRLEESSLSPYERTTYNHILSRFLAPPNTTAKMEVARFALIMSFLGVDIPILDKIMCLFSPEQDPEHRLDVEELYAAMRLLSHVQDGQDFRSDLVFVTFTGPTEHSTTDAPKTPETHIFLPEDLETTPPKAPLPTSSELDERITQFKAWLLPRIRAFLERQQTYWTPPDSVTDHTTRMFYAEQKIQCYDGKPSLLMDRLGQHPTPAKVAEFINKPVNSVIYDTSGSGKTRFTLECLHRLWGFYLVAEPGPDNIGWNDLSKAIKSMENAKGWESDVFANGLSIPATADKNHKIAIRSTLKVLVSRWIVFQTFIEAVKAMNGSIPEDAKSHWVIFQTLPLYVKLFTGSMNPFTMCINNCLLGVDTGTLTNRLSSLTPETILGRDFDSKFLYVLDEAQVACHTYISAFADAGYKAARPVLRPIIRTLLDAAELKPFAIIVSGTGFSHKHIDSILSSAVGKDAWNPINTIGDFMDREQQSKYTSQYIPPSFLFGSTSGKFLTVRMHAWLRGRPRFTARFVEELLNRAWTKDAPASPHKLLDAYIKAYSTFMPVDGPIEVMSQEPDVGHVNIRTFDWTRIEQHGNFLRDLAMTLYSYIIQGRHLPLFDEHRYLIEFGLARFTGTDQRSIREPLALVSILQYFQTHDQSLSGYLRMHLQFDRGKAFESIVLFSLSALFGQETPLEDVFSFHDTSSPLMKSKGLIVRRTSNGDFTSLHDSPPDDALATRAFTSTEVTRWIQHGTTAWCIPPESMGPDLLTWIQLANEQRVLVAIQAKSYFSGNEETISSGVMAKAIHTINPKRFYSYLKKRKKGTPGETKLRGDIDDMLKDLKLPQDFSQTGYYLLGVIAAFPLDANFGSSSKKVTAALKGYEHSIAKLSHNALVKAFSNDPIGALMMRELITNFEKERAEGERRLMEKANTAQDERKAEQIEITQEDAMDTGD